MPSPDRRGSSLDGPPPHRRHRLGDALLRRGLLGNVVNGLSDSLSCVSGNCDQGSDNSDSSGSGSSGNSDSSNNSANSASSGNSNSDSGSSGSSGSSGNSGSNSSNDGDSQSSASDSNREASVGNNDAAATVASISDANTDTQPSASSASEDSNTINTQQNSSDDNTANNFAAAQTQESSNGNSNDPTSSAVVNNDSYNNNEAQQSSDNNQNGVNSSSSPNIIAAVESSATSDSASASSASASSALGTTSLSSSSATLSSSLSQSASRADDSESSSGAAQASSSSATISNDKLGSNSNGLSSSAVAGISIGVILGVALFLLCGCIAYRRKKRRDVRNSFIPYAFGNGTSNANYQNNGSGTTNNRPKDRGDSGVSFWSPEILQRQSDLSSIVAAGAIEQQGTTSYSAPPHQGNNQQYNDVDIFHSPDVPMYPRDQNAQDLNPGNAGGISPNNFDYSTGVAISRTTPENATPTIPFPSAAYQTSDLMMMTSREHLLSSPTSTASSTLNNSVLSPNNPFAPANLNKPKEERSAMSLIGFGALMGRDSAVPSLAATSNADTPTAPAPVALSSTKGMNGGLFASKLRRFANGFDKSNPHASLLSLTESSKSESTVRPTLRSDGSSTRRDTMDTQMSDPFGEDISVMDEKRSTITHSHLWEDEKLGVNRQSMQTIGEEERSPFEDDDQPPVKNLSRNSTITGSFMSAHTSYSQALSDDASVISFDNLERTARKMNMNHASAVSTKRDSDPFRA